MGVLAINNTYLVDVLQGRSVEAIAVNKCVLFLGPSPFRYPRPAADVLAVPAYIHES
jgi:hypothetical protein